MKNFNLNFCDVGYFTLKQLLLQNKKILQLGVLYSIINETITKASEDNINVVCGTTYEDFVNLDNMVSSYFKTLTANEGSLIIFVKKENTILEAFENDLVENTNPTAQMLLQKYSGQKAQTILNSDKNTLTSADKQALLEEAMHPESWREYSTDEIFENTQFAKKL